MGRPKKHSSLAPNPIEAGNDFEYQEAPSVPVPKVEVPKSGTRVKSVHLAIGVDLLGSKTSLQSGRNATLEATAIGIKAYSKNSNRIVVIPYSNVKGFELFPGE